MSSWGCPHEIDGKCARINNVPCDPGMKGCVLFGRFIWADEGKNRPANNAQSETQVIDKKNETALPAGVKHKDESV